MRASLTSPPVASFEPLDSVIDALAVRRLRNSCAASLTNHRRSIGRLAQILWYLRRYRAGVDSGRYRVFLFREGTTPNGYGALRLRDDELLITECVALEHRGRGLGRQILSRLREIGRSEGRDLIAEIWSSNQASITIHEKAGFVHENTVDRRGEPMLVYRLPSS